MNKIKESGDPKLALEIILIKIVSEITGNVIGVKINHEKKDVINVKSTQTNEETISLNESAITNENNNVDVQNVDESEINETAAQLEEKQENSTFNIEPNVIEEKILSKDELITEIKRIRVNNTLSRFDKRILIEYRNRMFEINNYRNNSEYQAIVDLIIDRTLKAISDEYMIFESQDNYSVNCFIRELEKIEKLIELVFGKCFKVVTVSTEEWNKIKVEFNNKTVTYEYESENPKYIEELNNIIKKEKEIEDDELTKMFGSCVVHS